MLTKFFTEELKSQNKIVVFVCLLHVVFLEFFVFLVLDCIFCNLLFFCLCCKFFVVFLVCIVFVYCLCYMLKCFLFVVGIFVIVEFVVLCVQSDSSL